MEDIAKKIAAEIILYLEDRENVYELELQKIIEKHLKGVNYEQSRSN